MCCTILVIEIPTNMFSESINESKPIRSWAPKVAMWQAMKRLGRFLSYYIESNLSLDSFVSLYDKGTSWDFLILFTFFSFVPMLGKRVDAQLQGPRLGTTGLMAPTSVFLIRCAVTKRKWVNHVSIMRMTCGSYTMLTCSSGCMDQPSPPRSQGPFSPLPASACRAMFTRLRKGEIIVDCRTPIVIPSG